MSVPSKSTTNGFEFDEKLKIHLQKSSGFQTRSISNSQEALCCGRERLGTLGHNR
jgi:hypothetical protein